MSHNANWPPPNPKNDESFRHVIYIYGYMFIYFLLHSSLAPPNFSSLLLCRPQTTMSRHNRRRTRGERNASAGLQLHALELPFSAALSHFKLPTATHLQRNDLSAKHWHNRHLAWQARDREQKDECQRLNEERKRIFGGDGNDGEDDGLCSRMMDYFVRLDFLRA